MPNEQTPLLHQQKQHHDNPSDNPHSQFCMLVGIPPSNLSSSSHHDFPIGHKSLYGRATRQHSTQQFNYVFTASLSNMLLLSQVVLSAALTALGASESSHILITIFGVLNTIIAGLVAWLKSRGQPMRSRMYRDDLERVVDEIENSETMWLGISKGVHGYGEIDTDDKVTVRSEVARLTRLYDRAVRSNTMNNPDMYMASAGGDVVTSLRARPDGAGAPALPPAINNQALPAASAIPAAAATPAPPPPAPEDESPATAAPKPASKEPDKEPDKGNDKDSTEAAKKKEETANSAAEPTKPSTGEDKSKAGAKPESQPDNPSLALASQVPQAPPPLAPGSVATAPDDSPATAVDPSPLKADKEKEKEKEKAPSKDKDEQIDGGSKSDHIGDDANQQDSGSKSGSKGE